MIARKVRTASLAWLVSAARMRPLTLAERRLSGSNAATRRAMMARRAAFAQTMRRLKRRRS